MRGRRRVLGILALALLAACAHPISIAPKLEAAVEGTAPVQRSVAYVVSAADRDREVTTPGGGGDQVSYFPYRDLETGIFRALSQVYARVTLLRAASDAQAPRNSGATLVFLPEVTTGSYSTGLLTWPPTNFTVAIRYRVTDRAGAEVYSNGVVGMGAATFEEFLSEFGLAGRRASEDALRKFTDQVKSAPELK